MFPLEQILRTPGLLVPRTVLIQFVRVPPPDASECLARLLIARVQQRPVVREVRSCFVRRCFSAEWLIGPPPLAYLVFKANVLYVSYRLSTSDDLLRAVYKAKTTNSALLLLLLLLLVVLVQRKPVSQKRAASCRGRLCCVTCGVGKWVSLFGLGP